MTRVLSWNVAGRVRSVAAQAAALAGCDADLIALQEVRASALAAWERELAALGYPHIAATLTADHVPLGPERRLGVLIAGRRPLEPLAPLELPWPERHLAVRAELADDTVVELHDLHAPLSSKSDLVKVRTLETVFAHLAAPSELPRILAGDLNTPRYESREGDVQTFARTRAGRIRPDYGERHDAAELALIVGLRAHGYRDAFRDLHGYGRRDRSWLYPHRKTGSPARPPDRPRPAGRRSASTRMPGATRSLRRPRRDLGRPAPGPRPRAEAPAQLSGSSTGRRSMRVQPFQPRSSRIDSSRSAIGADSAVVVSSRSTNGSSRPSTSTSSSPASSARIMVRSIRSAISTPARVIGGPVERLAEQAVELHHVGVVEEIPASTRSARRSAPATGRRS